MINTTDIANAQRGMRFAYYMGAPGVLASALAWLVAGSAAVLVSPSRAVLALFVGGMMIHPVSVALTKLLGRPGVHSRGNPLGPLALESTILLLLCLPLAYVVFLYRADWFFPDAAHRRQPCIGHHLFYLAWKALRPQTPPTALRALTASGENVRVVRDGFVVALLNPKTALFFGAFLPQFVVPSTAHASQPLVLGALFVLIAAATDTLYAFFASLAAPYFVRATAAATAGRFAVCGAYIGLGLFAVLSGNRSNR